jgi:hypothetical protein
VPEQRCEEEVRLTSALVHAINDVYVAKQVLEAARKQKADTDQFVIALNDAKAEERRAIKALDTHKLEHGCANIAGRAIVF